MAPRRTQSASARAKEAEKNQPDNLVESDDAAEQREQDLKDAEKNIAAEKEAGKARAALDTAEQAYKSSHVPTSPREEGHPGYFPDQYTRDGVVYGHFCVVSDGEHEGAYGVYVDNVASDENGRPTVVIVRERNTGRMLTVNYDDLAPASGGDVGRGRP